MVWLASQKSWRKQGLSAPPDNYVHEGRQVNQPSAKGVKWSEWSRVERGGLYAPEKKHAGGNPFNAQAHRNQHPDPSIPLIRRR